jgi:hypothetical protein
VLLACLATFGAATPARAECPFFVVPPATDAARSAREIIVGTVIENVGGQLYDFRLRVDHVLRGPAKVGEIRRIDRLFPRWPLIEAADGKLVPPCEAIPGWKGNVMAISLDALAPDGHTRYNAASWIEGDLEVVAREIPATTLDEMIKLAALPATDAPELALAPPSSEPVPVLPILAIGVAAAALGVRWAAGRRA